MLSTVVITVLYYFTISDVFTALLLQSVKREVLVMVAINFGIVFLGRGTRSGLCVCAGMCTKLCM